MSAITRKISIFIGMLMVAAFPVMAQDAIVIGDKELPIAEQQTSGHIVFPAIRNVPGKIPILKARIFFNSPQPAGWNNSTSIVLNGKQLTRYTADGNERLLRRGEYLVSTIEQRAWWNNINGLLVMFGPGQGEMDSRIITPRNESYWYYLDISDVVNYIEYGLDDRIQAAQNNNLVLLNGLTLRLAGKLNHSLTFKDMEIIYISKNEAASQRPEAPMTIVAEAPAAQGIAHNNVKVTVTTGGGLVLERNGEKYYWSAAFSYPAKPTMKFDKLSPEAIQGRPGWQPVIARNGDTITVTAATPDRKVTRTLRFTGELLEVTDAFTNLAQEDVGLSSQFTTISASKLAVDAICLAGMRGISKETGCGANPTLYMQGKTSGFGAMALEAAFRCHLELSKTGANTAVMQNPAAIKAGETYSQKYLLTLTDTPDYFAFINALRRHLKLNHTIEGPMGLGITNITQNRQVCITTERFYTNWFEYGDEEALERDRAIFAKLFNQGRERYRKLYPGIKILPKLEMSPLNLNKNKIKRAERLPVSKKELDGIYGQAISKEATEVIDQETPYGDSILRTKDGRAIIDTYYPKEPLLSLLVYAYQNNSYEKRLFEQADFLLDVVKADGIYIDQFATGSMYTIESGRDRISYDRWDGRTALLKPDGTIDKKLFDIAYSCADARIRFIHKVLDKGKVFLANTHPVTSEEADAGGYRFSESDSENLAPMLTSTGKPALYRMQTLSQLSPCPMVLGMRPARFSKDRTQWARMYNRAFIGGLRHGILTCHYGMSGSVECYGLVNHSFPITPVELGEGFIIGEERILTAVSRAFITTVKPKKIVGFDAEGKDLPDVATLEQTADGRWKTTVKLNDWNSSCVIVLSGLATPFDKLNAATTE